MIERTVGLLRGACVALLTSTSAAAQSPPSAPAQAQTHAMTLPAKFRAAVAAIADSARREGLPAELLEAKASEGLAKGAEPEAIVAVVADYRRLLMRSLRILGSAAQGGELAAAASALKAGISDIVIGDVKRAAGERPSTVSLVVLTDLVTRGVRAADAARAITSLTARGASDRELTELRRAVAQDIAGGRDPIATLRARAIRPRPLTAAPLRTSPVELSAVTSLNQVRRSGVSGWRAAAGYGSGRAGARAGVAQWLPAAARTGSPEAASWGIDVEGWYSIRPGLALRASVAQHTGSGARTATTQDPPFRPDSGGCVAPPSNPQACSNGSPGSSSAMQGSSSVALTALWGRHRWLLEAGGGRSVLGRPAQWLTLGATRWISPSVGAMISIGGDPRAALGAGDLRVGMILRPFSRDGEPLIAATPDLIEEADSPLAARVEAGSDGVQLLIVPGRAAAVLEYRGDATGWRAAPMIRAANGEWHASLSLRSGLHHVQVRMDGGDWTAPAGLPVAADDFRGIVAVIVQP